MSKKLLFATSTILLAVPIYAFVSCQSGQQASFSKITYGQKVTCQSEQEMNDLFQNNKDQWPQTGKTNYPKQEFETKELNDINANANVMYFDLLASICKYNRDKNIISFSLAWNTSNNNLEELTLTDVNQSSIYTNVRYILQGDNKVVLSLKSNQTSSTIIPSFAYGNIVIE